MAHHNSRIPEPGTYHRVLRRHDRDPRFAHQQTYVAYDVALRAVACKLRGTEAMTLFFPKGKEKAADRAMRLGWLDCTDEWHQAAAGLGPEDQIAAMSWGQVLSTARTRGLDTTGKRPVVEQRLLDHMLAAN